MIRRHQAWITVALLLLLLLTVQGIVTAGVATFDARITDDLKIGRGALKFRDFVQIVSAGLSGICIGYITLYVRPRYLARIGLVMLALGLFLYSKVTHVWMIYLIHMLLLGFAYSTAHVVVIVLILKQWFARRQAIAISIALAGGSLGASLVPQIVVQLLRHYDWRETFQWLAVFPLILLPFIVFLLKEYEPNAGMVRYGEDSEAPQPDLMEARQAASATKITMSRPTRRNFIFLAIAAFGTFYAGAALIYHTFLNLKDHGFSEQASATGISVIFATGLAGKVMSGFLAEKFGTRRVWQVHQVVMLTGALVLTFSDIELVWVGIVCLGLGWGGCFSLTQVMIAEQFSGPVLGRLLGWFIAFEGFGSGSGSWLTGVMFDRSHNYFIPFMVCNLLIGLSMVATFLLRPPPLVDAVTPGTVPQT